MQVQPLARFHGSGVSLTIKKGGNVAPLDGHSLKIWLFFFPTTWWLIQVASWKNGIVMDKMMINDHDSFRVSILMDEIMMIMGKPGNWGYRGMLFLEQTKICSWHDHFLSLSKLMGNFLRPVLLVWQSGSQVSWMDPQCPAIHIAWAQNRSQPTCGLWDFQAANVPRYGKSQGLEGAIALDSDGKASKCAYVCISVCIHIHIHVHIHVHIYIYIHICIYIYMYM